MKFNAKITEIRQNSGICFIKFNSNFGEFAMLGLEIPNGISNDKEAVLNFKSSDVIISREKLQNCSLTNEIKAEILDIRKDEILACIRLKIKNFIFESIISANSANRLKLAIGDEIFAYIKATSLFIESIK